MAEEHYILALQQGLNKKVAILDTIIALNIQQKDILDNVESAPEELEENIEAKAQKIEELTLLDDGFEQVYERVKEELSQNREQYASVIADMQKQIAAIMDKSARIQGQEQRNRNLMEQRFSIVRKQIKEVKHSTKAVNSYYQNMMKMNYVDPQYMDDKK